MWGMSKAPETGKRNSTVTETLRIYVLFKIVILTTILTAIYDHNSYFKA